MEDEEIIELYFGRSENAITQTKEKYNSFCYSISYNILHSHEEAEECVNEAYYHLWNTIPPNRPNRLTAFLGRIVKNISLSKWRMNHSQGRGSGIQPVQFAELEECIDMKYDIESEQDKAEISEAVKAFIQNLDDFKQRIFIQRYWYMMEIKQIAADNNIGDSKVKMMLLRMRNELKEYLMKKELF